MNSYRPHPKTKELLNYAMEIVRRLPYKPTLRYVFYRLMQHRGLKKEDYTRVKSSFSHARKQFWNGWRPDTLADDRRETIRRGHGFPSGRDWLEALANVSCTLDVLERQPNLVEIWFEAQAMVGQFEYYTEDYRVTLVPFGGDPSIPYKWGIAKRIEWLGETYPGKPIIILYYGDLDKKGIQIAESAVRDIRVWSTTPFEFKRVALNPGDEIRYQLPENPEKPSNYQWEAVPDVAAEELIKGELERYWRLETVREVAQEEAAIEKGWRQDLAALIREKWSHG